MGSTRPLLFLAANLLALAAAGCAHTTGHVLSHVLLPEQRTAVVRDPARLPPAPIPPLPPPRTVADPDPGPGEWRMSLDEAITIALRNARVIRVLTGVTAQSSGRTIYDTAIANTLVDQQQARFDPVFDQRSRLAHTETPRAFLDPFSPGRSRIFGSYADEFRSETGLSKTNVVGGEWRLSWIENPVWLGSELPGSRVPLHPQNNNAFEVAYTQPLLQGGGFLVNMAPVVIARLDTERSFFQYKDSVQDLVRGVIEAYWNLVQARTDVWARKIQVDQAEEAYKREQARKKVGLADLGDVAQSRVTYHQFRANLIAARANVLVREGALRNILGLPPSDCLQIVPTSPPASTRLRPCWKDLVCLAEQRRPDIVELKLILEADSVRLLQAENQTLPRLDAVALYRWNGLTGDMPNGERLATGLGEFTDWSVGVNFSVPLGLREGRARVRERALILARDRANLEQGLHAAVHELALTVRDLDNSFEQYLAFKETREAARDNLLVQIEEFRTRRNIYLNVLQALNDWGNAITSEVQALIAYNISLATLERQTGTILETHGLIFHEERHRFAGPLGLCGHERCYPAAHPPVGTPDRYPGKDEPAENAFDLQQPEIRRRGGEEASPPPTLPPPRKLPGSER